MYKPTALAGEPTRSSATITVSWGLVTIPLSVYSGSEEVRVARKEFVDGDPARPAGRAVIDKNAGFVISPDRVEKLAEADNGTWVKLDDDEIAACASPKGLAEIVSFVPMQGIWEYIPEDIAQVRPPNVKGKVDAGGTRAFALFLEAMRQREVCALIKFAVRGSAKFGLITPDANLIYVKSADQIRKPRPLPTVEIDDKMLLMAGQLIDQVGRGAPVIKNDTAERVRDYVNKKAADPALKPPAPFTVTPVDDIMSLLMGSIAK